jgi:hypothetical protein
MKKKMNFEDEREETDSGMFLNLLADEPGEAEAAMVLNSIVDRPEELQDEAAAMIKTVKSGKV